MTTFTVALIACTALCLAFKESRGLGIVGVFALIFIAPLVLGSLLIVAGLIYFFLMRKNRYEIIPKGNMLPPGTTRRGGVGLLVLTALTAGVLALAYTPAPREMGYHAREQGETRSAPIEHVLVLRTKGGMLETARIEVQEVLDATFTHSVLGIEIGETAPRIRVTATYRFAVPLSEEWSVVGRDGFITAMSPPIEPTLPVAIDTATLEKSVAGAWLLVPLTGDNDLERLERSITATLARKSGGYRQRALEESRKTISEFVRTWATQAGYDVRGVRVVFEGEPIRSIEAVSG